MGELVSVWIWGISGDVGRLGDPFLKGLFLLERYGSWFWNLGRDSLVLGRGSREGLRRE